MDQRAQQLINNLTQDIQSKFQDQSAYLQTLTQLMQQYQSVGLDLIQLKQKYAEIVKQYSMNNSFRPTPNTFPGVAPTTPTYSTEKMQMDSKQLAEMGELINDLENQKQLVYNQVRKVLEAIVVITTSAATTIDQVSVYLSQMIDNIGRGVYGSPTLRTSVV